MKSFRLLFVGLLCGAVGGLFVGQQQPDLISDIQNSIDMFFEKDLEIDDEETVFGIQSIVEEIAYVDEKTTPVIDYTDSICGTISHRRNIDMSTPTIVLNNNGLRESTYMCNIAKNGEIIDSFPSLGGVGIYPPKTYNYRKSQDSRDFSFEEIQLGVKDANGTIKKINIAHSCDTSEDFEVYIGCMQDTLDIYTADSIYTLSPNTTLGGGIDEEGSYFLYIYMYDLTDLDTNSLLVLTDAISDFDGIYKAGFAQQAFDYTTCRYTPACGQEVIKTKRIVEGFGYNDVTGLEILDPEALKTIDYLNGVDMNGIYTNNHLSICTSELSCCGDGIEDEGEECDTGINNDDSDGCTDQCTIVVEQVEAEEVKEEEIGNNQE